MRLKEIETIVPVAVVRDSLFQTLGFLSDPQAGMLVFLGSRD